MIIDINNKNRRVGDYNALYIIGELGHSCESNASESTRSPSLVAGLHTRVRKGNRERKRKRERSNCRATAITTFTREYVLNES